MVSILISVFIVAAIVTFSSITVLIELSNYFLVGIVLYFEMPSTSIPEARIVEMMIS